MHRDKIIDILQNSIINGETPLEIKKNVMKTLSVYFNNKELLDRYATSSEILSVYEYTLRYGSDNDFSAMLQDVLKCYRNAYKIDSTKTLEIIISNHEEFSQKENMMWTVRQHVPNNVNGDLYDSAMSYFDYIGQSLEIGIKHILFELYAMIMIGIGKSIDYENIKKRNFGSITNDFLSQGYFEDMLKTKPVDIKLSDWRNIAYHNAFKIEGEIITCTYGKKNQTFQIDFEQLQYYTHQIIRASNVLNIGRCIYVFDNIDNIRNYSNIKKKTVTFRKDMLINQLRISLSSQGFHLERIDEDKFELKIILHDIRNNGMMNEAEIRMRQILSSQFTYNFWCVLPKNRVAIIYCDRHGKKLFASSINGTICEKIKEGKEKFSNLAEYIDFKKIETN